MSRISKKRQAFVGLPLPHIGKMLKKHVTDNRLYQAPWARKQGVKEETIVGFFKKPTMQIATLFAICQILNYNFFKAVANALPADMPHLEKNQLQEELDNLKMENEKLKIKLQVMEEIMFKKK